MVNYKTYAQAELVPLAPAPEPRPRVQPNPMDDGEIDADAPLPQDDDAPEEEDWWKAMAHANEDERVGLKVVLHVAFAQ